MATCGHGLHRSSLHNVYNCSYFINSDFPHNFIVNGVINVTDGSLASDFTISDYYSVTLTLASLYRYICSFITNI